MGNQKHNGVLRFWHGIEGVALTVVLVTLPGVLLSFFFNSDALDDKWWMWAANGAAVTLLFAAGTFWVLKINNIAPGTLFNLKMSRPGLTFLAAAGVIPAGVLVDSIAGWLHLLNPDLFSISAIDGMAAVFFNAPVWGFVILAVVFSLMPAIAEELLFRGLVLESFRRDMPAGFAVIYSSLLFGFIHFNWLQGSAAVFLGIYLAFTAVQTGSIIPAMAAHFINNLSWCLLAGFDSAGMEKTLNSGYDTLTTVASSVALAVIIALLIAANKETTRHKT